MCRNIIEWGEDPCGGIEPGFEVLNAWYTRNRGDDFSSPRGKLNAFDDNKGRCCCSFNSREWTNLKS